jgi:hypothetical protein
MEVSVAMSFEPAYMVQLERAAQHEPAKQSLLSFCTHPGQI